LSDRFEKAHAGMDLAQKETEAKEFRQRKQKDLDDYNKTLND
jgi:hypothetical protein